MPDGFSITVDTAALLRAMDKVGVAIERYTKEAAHQTALAVQAEAKRRIRRRTGKTAEGIVVREDYGRVGYVVVTEDVVSGEERAARESWRQQMGVSKRRASFVNSRYQNVPHVGLYLEKGTIQGKWPSHTLPARPFFDVSADVEQGPHRRRMLAAIQQGIADAGLGD